jgi:hypothetical protein
VSKETEASFLNDVQDSIAREKEWKVEWIQIEHYIYTEFIVFLKIGIIFARELLWIDVDEFKNGSIDFFTKKKEIEDLLKMVAKKYHLTCYKVNREHFPP